MRNYYRKRGYQLEGLFMTKELCSGTISKKKVDASMMIAAAAVTTVLVGFLIWFRK